MTNFQAAVLLTNRCRAAYAAGDMEETFRLLALRDEAYVRIETKYEALLFVDFARGRIEPERLQQLLESEEAS
jgi:hypothetical protein